MAMFPFYHAMSETAKNMVGLEFSDDQRDKFRYGKLAEEWFTRFPQIFDEDDLRLAKSQPLNHFCEWLSAVVIFETTGWLSLIEKYQFRNHQRKQKVLNSLITNEEREAFDSIGAQLPDLLIYKSDFSRWEFREVKGPGDVLRPEQIIQFERLESRLGKQVKYIRLTMMNL